MRVKHIIALSVMAAVVVLFVLWRIDHAKLKAARNERDVAVATGKALDSVAAKTDTIRAEQEEKQNEVDRIEGADQRLPDGFGAAIERVRRGG